MPHPSIVISALVVAATVIGAVIGVLVPREDVVETADERFGW